MRSALTTIGIVGGLCPLATADIYLKTMKQVKGAQGDFDYPDIIISAALEQELRGNKFDDTPEHNYDMSHRFLYIYQVARELKERGVGKILVPDFLSYSFAKTISDNVEVPLFDIVTILASAIKRKWPKAEKVGLLTCTLSIRNKVFEDKFAEKGLRIIYPDADVQENLIMEALYGAEGLKRGVTNGKPGEMIREACRHLYAKGGDVVASAVTELPLLERRYYPEQNYLDCNEAIAWELVNNTISPKVEYENQKVVGILGGLGPAATVDIFDKIVKNTPASRDQCHLKVIVENNPQIPDRTAALRGLAEDPSVAMLATAERLEASGADFIIVPCNTAHVFLEAVQEHIGIPVLSMIEETAKYIALNFPNVKKTGLLATSGTVESGVYKDPLSRKGIELVLPSSESQEKCVMQAVYGEKGIKAGFKNGLPRTLLLSAAEELITQGAEIIILGCTEIPLALRNGDASVPFIDPTEILAKAAISQAMT